MTRFKTLTVVATLGLTASALAHTTFILPETAGDAPPRVRLIFSETMEPEDGRAAKEKLPLVELHTRSASNEVTDLSHEPAEASRVAALPDDRPRVVYGSMQYGLYVSFRADPPATYLLSYYPKAVVGDWADEAIARVGTPPVELVPVKAEDGVAFRLEFAGKPAPEQAVTVRLPDGESRKVVTDADGLTPVFDKPGRYGVSALERVETSGVHDGEPYDAVMRGASLVIDLD